jgi:superfamily I DNA/RNA helicase
MPFEKDGEVQNMTEERCLAYVAMTRAENHLYLHHPKTLDMRMGQGPKRLKQSRFYNEFLDRQDIEIEAQPGKMAACR